ncbi:hypothetical protein BO78DRAFT_423569 [Aspergillus sclerotiicarbonarius CBS 121057]|uniref:Alcohol dehydrogenase-like C-terminal domain-containing protein n=1 Tax=Aspergillus sclerotiicarbonarius (strain CBS 121057 / IBT 28362) TaxID=1448318 RepID=A0A319DUQ4_ASPSB|nr:hypothetical protein BO78DRAFT_423569 [Aspergillus sclerotiicarbonarius CBS 121057]
MTVNTPSTRKVAVCIDTQHIAIQERRIPTPHNSEVLVQIEAAGICATDLHLVRRSIRYLQRKVDLMVFRIYDCHSRYLMRIPEDISAVEAAPTLCAGADNGIQGPSNCGSCSRQWVAIVGAGGGLGHLAVQYARASGLRALGIDTGSSKRDLCSRLGATAYIDFIESQDLAADIIQMTDGGPHGVIVVSSSSKAYEQALAYVRKMGIIVSPNKMNFPVGPEHFVARGIRLTGSSAGTMEDTREALEYVRDGRVKPMIVETQLEGIEACLQALEKGEVEGRFVATLEGRSGRL